MANPPHMTPTKEQMTMKQMMSRRAVVRVPSGPASIETIDVPVVEPGPGELRVKIGAAAINPVDLGVAGGLFHQLALVDQPDYTGLRSEEHTSELQSLMRHSYAVFCLKKKKQ